MKTDLPLSIIITLNNKNKRFFNLAEDFLKNLNPYCISGLTKQIEKLLLIDFKFMKMLKITHIWIFSQRKLSTFIHFSSVLTSRIISFEVTKFVLKKEFYKKKNSKNRCLENIFLFLNNISENSNFGVFLNKYLRKIVPIKKNTEVISGKFSRCILFDFDDESKIMEYRCYDISNSDLFLPRKIRKIKKLIKNKMINKNSQIELCNNLNNCNELYKNKIKNIVRLVEIGPRITSNIINQNCG
jgi:hypothetical protein